MLVELDRARLPTPASEGGVLDVLESGDAAPGASREACGVKGRAPLRKFDAEFASFDREA